MIRIAKHHDLPAIIRIYNQAILAKNATADLSPKRAEEQILWFEEHDPTMYPIYVYEDQGQILGWCSISPYRQGREAVKEVGEISYYVEYSHHGQGIGSALVAYALKDCGRIGKRILFAIIIEGNVRSIQLLQKYGFEQWGYLPNVVNIDGILKGHVYLGKERFFEISRDEPGVLKLRFSTPDHGKYQRTKRDQCLTYHKRPSTGSERTGENLT